jgi:apolipoprotein N-acyltransferase
MLIFNPYYSLSTRSYFLFLFLSFVAVSFGQPAWNPYCAIFASCIGYAFFWRLLICHANRRHRFWIATLWFTGVQLVQLSWLISHPYSYIYALYFALAFGMGLQFGLLSLFVTPDRLKQLRYLLGIAGLWVLMEWSRLFILSGFSFNPVGLALTASIYSLQFASLCGIYGLSFWVVFVNLLGLKAALQRLSIKPIFLWACAGAVPYLFGSFQLNIHAEKLSALAASGSNQKYEAVLVQTSFPVEETLKFKNSGERIEFVLEEWKKILKITKKHLGVPFDLLVLPEGVVPYGTYSFIYPSSIVSSAFKKIYGPQSLRYLPPLEEPLAMSYETPHGQVWMVNNAYWTQALANIFQAEVLIGLNDVESNEQGKTEYYSSAIHLIPNSPASLNFQPTRYEKRVLVPMGEYIPFSFLAKLAEDYGVAGSFTPGKEAKVIEGKKKLGISICYEETYADLMRENKQKGAELLINLTSDIWYPNSRLIWQHFDHARLRTVENGLPLLRACNTGVTAGLDSLGRIVAQLGQDHENIEALADSLFVSIPTYTYPTLYSHFGDSLIIGISLLAVSFCLGSLLIKKK